MNKAIVSCVLGLAVGAASADVLDVGREETVNIGSDASYTGVSVHGRLNVSGGAKLTVNDGSNFAFVELAPNKGDVGVMTVDGGTIWNEGNSARVYVRIGASGGGDGAKLTLANTSSKWSYWSWFKLIGDARTEADAFEGLEMGVNSHILVQHVENGNAKPLVISFTGSSDGGYGLRQFFGGWFFGPTSGDIVLKSVDGNPIHLGQYGNGTTANLLDTSATGWLKTEGTGDVWIESGEKAAFVLNRTNVSWGHSGDLKLGGTSACGTVRTTVDGVLPYGPSCGEVVLRSATSASSAPSVFDLSGTRQCLNGLNCDARSVVTNSSDEVAVLVFGEGDVDGTVSKAVLTNSAIRCVKTGSGVLTLDGASLNELSGDGGRIHIVSKTFVDTLALTNGAISFAKGDVSLLTVRNMRLGPDVTFALPDGAATNCVFLSCPVVSGAVAVKEGNGFVTYATPADAQGMELRVKAGVLRFGGVSSENTWWRLLLKKSNGNGRTYTFADGNTKFISSTIGTFALFSETGLHTVGGISSWRCDTGSNPDDLSDMPEGNVTTKRPALEWSTDIYKAQYPEAAKIASKDPILGGALARRNMQALIQNNNIYSNCYDVACTTGQSQPIVFNWSSGIMFDGPALDPQDASTWEVVTWRNTTSWPKSHVSYALRRMPNMTNPIDPYVTDWALQSSPDGTPGSWVTMDERSGQRWWKADEPGSSGLDPQCQYTYNNHVPYLFRSLNANWRFTTFGPVSVAAGAKLDLSELKAENIAFNGLRVDLAAGAGTITHFAPAPNGVLYLTNAANLLTSDGRLPPRVRLPLVIEEMISSENLASWTVCVDGEPKKDAKLVVRNGELVVRTEYGLVMLVK